MPGATDPMQPPAAERATAVGRYELIGVNGGLLPVSVEPGEGAPGGARAA